VQDPEFQHQHHKTGTKMEMTILSESLRVNTCVCLKLGQLKKIMLEVVQKLSLNQIDELIS
jgi:hypothetical protein